MKNLESALKELLLKRNDSNEDQINAIAAPLNGARGCLDCMCDESLAGAISEFRANCEQSGHSDVVAILDES